ncbi:MAG: hypothetical protein J6K86_03970, partial [Clostridia bacterium]|nr:hypothetical protein [Clostridia bacterium]
MKKQIIGILAVLSCLACLGGCLEDTSLNTNKPGYSIDSTSQGSEAGTSEDSESTETPAVNFKAVKAILKGMYDQEIYSNNNVDFEVVKMIPNVLGVDYTLSWSVDVTEGVVLQDKGDVVKVNVDEASTEPINYVLTATITAPDGSTDTQNFRFTVKAISQYVTAAIKGKPAENTAYKFHVYQSSLQTDLYFAGAMDGYYFKTTDNSEEAADIYVEYVTGSETNFNLYFFKDTVDETSGETIEDVKHYIGMRVSEDGGHNNIVFDAKGPVSEFYWSDTYNTIITMLEKDRDGNSNVEFYLGNYGTLKTISGSVASQHFGKEGNNVGELVGLVDRTQIPDAEKVADTVKTLGLKSSYQCDAEVELPERGTTYPEALVSWTCESELVTINDNTMTFAPVTEATEVTLVATVTCGNESKTTEVKISIMTALPADGSTLTIPEALAIGKNLTEDTTQKYYVSGKITSFYGSSGTTYGNVNIEDADGNTILVYGLFNEDGTVRYDKLENKPVVGDTIKVYGVLTQFNGTAQFKNAWIIEHVAGEGGEGGGEDVADAYTLSFADKAQRTTFTDEQQIWEQNGVKVTNNKSTGTTNVADYANPARFYKGSEVIIEYTGMTKIVIASEGTASGKNYLDFLTQSLPTGTSFTVEGTTVTIVLPAAQDSYTFTCTAGQVRMYSITVYTGEVEGGGEVTPPEGGEDETPTTPEEILNALYALADGESLTGEFTLTGKITALDNYNNPTIVVEGFENKPVYCYKLKVENAVGDTITVTATSMKNYMGTYEFMNCTLVTGGGEVTPPEGGEGEEPTLTMVTSIVEGKPYHFSFSQSDGVTYYFAGKLNSQGFYLQGTTDLAASVPVYLEAATNAGEYYVYFMDGNAKTYIEMYVSGTHINPQLVTSTPA